MLLEESTAYRSPLSFSLTRAAQWLKSSLAKGRSTHVMLD
jgi:hypothetical protein